MKVWNCSKDWIRPVTLINGQIIDKKAAINGSKIEINSRYPKDFSIVRTGKIGKDDKNRVSCHSNKKNGKQTVEVKCFFKILSWGMTNEDKAVIVSSDKIKILNFTNTSPIQSILPPIEIEIYNPPAPTSLHSQSTSTPKPQRFFDFIASLIKYIWSIINSRLKMIFKFINDCGQACNFAG